MSVPGPAAPTEPGPPGGSLTDVPGVLVGHWTGAGTGVTAVLVPEATVGSCEVRGGAPATRETDLLDPTRLVAHVDAVVLTGGSAFGLAAADGAMSVLRSAGRGVATRGGPVPIVPAAAIFDLVESGGVAPGPAEGAAAVEAAWSGGAGGSARGRVGAGRGATIGKWRGAEHAVPGGLGAASARVEGDDGVVVGALAVCNAVGDVLAEDGTVLAGSRAPDGSLPFPEIEGTRLGPIESTTLVVVATNAALDKTEAHLLAVSAHHGLAGTVHPSHTRFDGDVAIALATGTIADAHVDRLRATATNVVARAVRAAVPGASTTAPPGTVWGRA